MFKPLGLVILGMAALGLALITSAAGPVAGEKDFVTINYALILKSGKIYDSSIKGTPVKVTLGEGLLLPALEAEVIGMHIGEFKTFTLPPTKAYGNYRPEMIGTFDRSMLPEGVEPEAGKQIQANLKDGTQVIAVITSFTDTSVTIDANHPLAGQTLTFEIELLGIGDNMTPASPIPTIFSWILLFSAVVITGFSFLKWRKLIFVSAVNQSPHTRSKAN